MVNGERSGLELDLPEKYVDKGKPVFSRRAFRPRGLFAARRRIVSVFRVSGQAIAETRR